MVGCLAAALVVVLMGLAGAPAAFAQSEVPWWGLNSTSAPTLLPRTGEGQLVVSASNLGDGEINATHTHVRLLDELPAGVRPVAVDGESSRGITGFPTCKIISQTVVCELAGSIPPYERLTVRITVAMEEPAEKPLINVVKAEGGETPLSQPLAPAPPLEKPLTVGDAETPFGVETYEMTPEDEGGSFDAQAGSHPFQLTSTLNFNQTLAYYATSSNEVGIYPSAPALPRNLHFKLPVGLVGDASAVPQCSDVDFTAVPGGEFVDLCPADTAVGVASVLINDPIAAGFGSHTVPIFNLVPGKGEPARFGFDVENVPVVLQTAVPTGGEYAVEVSVKNASQAAQILSSQVTFWGVPDDRSHDDSRGWECLGNGTYEKGKEHPAPCEALDDQTPVALLSLPTSCSAAPVTSMGGESWSAGSGRPGSPIPEGEHTTYTFPTALTGCGLLAFAPSLSVFPVDQHEGAESGGEEAEEAEARPPRASVSTASTPTGLNVTVDVPQESTLSGAPGALAEADINETTVRLPEGLQLNPAAASGLEACSALQFGFNYEGAAEGEQTQNLRFSPGSPECPDASKVATLKIKTPLLPEELTGFVYLAAQDTSPFRSPLVLYLVAENQERGVLVKLAGEVSINESTGQITTIFKNTPQLPFSQLKLHFFEGARSALSTPALCGTYSAQAAFKAWSGATHEPSSAPPFAITTGPGGGPCPPSPLPLAPSFQAGSSNSQAGGLTNFTVQIENPDGDQALNGLTIQLPPGLAALISTVTPCPEPPAGQSWLCGPESLIGHSAASSGLGSEPYTLPGQVYLTSGYDGAPFGLLVATEAKAGPFNLGIVDVRSRININPETAAVTITTDPGPREETFPTRLRGVPVQLKHLEVSVDRPGFQFNPTSCNPLAITGTINGDEGASSPISYPFQVTGCQSLPFAPILTAQAAGHGSKANGTSFDVKLTSAGLGQANIAKVDLQLPLALSTRNTTLNKACLETVFDTNPASCDEGSIIGKATIHTPVLKAPLTGPAYLVSHGGAAFPDVEFVLQGEGITIVLDGKTDVKAGITYSRFEAAPDAPFTSFETELPAGPHSILTPNVPEKEAFSLCKQTLTMPTTITAQNGATIEQTTPITITGCQGVLNNKTKKLTRAQLLTKALKTCRTRYKHKKTKRQTCEKQVRHKYGPTKKTAHKSSKDSHKKTV